MVALSSPVFDGGDWVRWVSWTLKSGQWNGALQTGAAWPRRLWEKGTPDAVTGEVLACGSQTAVRAAGKRELQRIVEGVGVRVVHSEVRRPRWNGPLGLERVTALDGVLARWVWWATDDERTELGDSTIDLVATRYTRQAAFNALTGKGAPGDGKEPDALATVVDMIRAVGSSGWLIGDWWPGR